MDQRPVGIFDSGLGGLSVWRELRRLMPQERMIYVADSANCPYGPRPAEEIVQLSERIARFLQAEGCKLIVVACNTATASAISHLRAHFDLPFVGMEPAIKPAAQRTRSGRIGVLATRGTFAGAHFHKTRLAHAAHVEVLVQPGDGLVECVERGDLNGPQPRSLLARYLAPMIEAGADQIVLGCTHYPFLRSPMEEILQGRAGLIDPGPAVARRAQELLLQSGAVRQDAQAPEYAFYTSGDPAQLERFLRAVIFGESVPAYRVARWQESARA
jgi:glutamate racemase